MTFLIPAVLLWILAWRLNVWLAAHPRTTFTRFVIPVIFGITVVVLWELLVRALNVPGVILPPPTLIAAKFVTSLDILWIDFVQTFVKGALSGYAIGCGSALAVAIVTDRSDFLKRGLLPLGNFVSALPIIGTAPIFVMWFGFGWQSKAAVVVAMTFFPMLVSTVQGLNASEPMQRDILRTYGSSYWQTLVKLRIPAAMPAIFNGLKICTTLSLIGAIVAEFFGSPIQGMGFRISTEVGRLALDLVWAEIVLAAITGSAFYGLVSFIDNRLSFWHPSKRV